MRKRWFIVGVAVCLCLVMPGCAGLSDWLDELSDDSLECAKEAQRAYSLCMSKPDDSAAVPPAAAESDGLVYLP